MAKKAISDPENKRVRTAAGFPNLRVRQVPPALRWEMALRHDIPGARFGEVFGSGKLIGRVIGSDHGNSRFSLDNVIKFAAFTGFRVRFLMPKTRF